MAGRAKEYMDQNLGLVQGGLSSAVQNVNPYLDQMMAEKKRQAELDRPATDWEKYVGGQLGGHMDNLTAKVVEEAKSRVKAGEDPQKVSIETRLKLMQLTGGSKGPSQVQLPEGPRQGVPYAPPDEAPPWQDMMYKGPGMSSVPTTRTLGVTSHATPDTQVQMPNPPEWNTGTPTRNISAVADGPMGSMSNPNTGFIVTRDPAKQSITSHVPEVKTRRDYETALAGSAATVPWKPSGTGQTQDQRMELERLKQEGLNRRADQNFTRAGLDRSAANMRAKLAADTTRYGVQMRQQMFMQSTSQINNAKELLQRRQGFVERLYGMKQLDANKRAALAAQARKYEAIVGKAAQLGAAFVQGINDGEDLPEVWDHYMQLLDFEGPEGSRLDEQINELMSDAKGDGMGGLNSTRATWSQE